MVGSEVVGSAVDEEGASVVGVNVELVPGSGVVGAPAHGPVPK